MLELQQQDIPKLKSERTVSNNTGQEDGANNGNSYDLVFPALPDSKTLGPKNTGMNGQCASSNAPSKGWSKVRLPIVNQVINFLYFIINYKLICILIKTLIYCIYVTIFQFLSIYVICMSFYNSISTFLHDDLKH